MGHLLSQVVRAALTHILLLLLGLERSGAVGRDVVLSVHCGLGHRSCQGVLFDPERVSNRGLSLDSVALVSLTCMKQVGAGVLILAGLVGGLWLG